jgi:predicted nucleic acid-binding protein
VALARYLADKSAYARLHLPAVHQRLAPLIERGLVATCTIIDLEVLFSTRTAADYDEVRAERAALERLDIDQLDWDRALDIQNQLVRAGLLRAVSLPDLVIAAVAERHRVTLLHYDHDFEHIRSVTRQAMDWIQPAGTIP